MLNNLLILECVQPDSNHLDVDIGKQKTNLRKKGSLAKRRKPTRSTVRSALLSGEEALFVDSTGELQKILIIWICMMVQYLGKIKSDRLFAMKRKKQDITPKRYEDIYRANLFVNRNYSLSIGPTINIMSYNILINFHCIRNSFVKNQNMFNLTCLLQNQKLRRLAGRMMRMMCLVRELQLPLLKELQLHPQPRYPVKSWCRFQDSGVLWSVLYLFILKLR